MDVRDYNRRAWNRQVEKGNRWTVPVSPEVTAAARRGEWQIFLTPTKPVPRAWFPALPGRDVLCLASGGGQQGPILAAAGARVTVYDNSPRQLDQDRMVAERDGLEIEIVEGDMRDLSAFPAASFDLIVHPVSNTFVPDVRPVWREAHRVLRPGGDLVIAEFAAPTNRAFRTIYTDYLVAALPRMARLVSSDAPAYTYLAESILAWPDRATLATWMHEAGFGDVKVKDLSGGIVAVHRGQRR